MRACRKCRFGGNNRCSRIAVVVPINERADPMNVGIAITRSLGFVPSSGMGDMIQFFSLYRNAILSAMSSKPRQPSELFPVAGSGRQDPASKVRPGRSWDPRDRLRGGERMQDEKVKRCTIKRKNATGDWG